jgi:hypothetical protein
MNPSDFLSVSLFKKSIAEYIPDYNSVDNEVVFKTLQRSLSDNIQDNALILSQELQQNQIDFKEILEDFISNLADHYVQNPNLLDPIITQLLNSNLLGFNSKVEELKELQIAIQRNERKRLKEILNQHDELQFQDDLEIAFQRIERKEKKEILREIEMQTESINMNQKTNWRFVMRIAALFILVLIPVGISIFFFNGNSNKNKGRKNNIYVETGDMTDLKKIDIPPAVFNLGSTILETNERGSSFSKGDEKIEITAISFQNQVAYLDEKIQNLESKYKEFKSKKINNKQSILESLLEVKEKCFLKKKELLGLESTYEFKNGKLKLFKQEKIDLKSIKVYSLSDKEDHKMFYLRIGEDYFNLSNVKGKLKKEAAPDGLHKIGPSGLIKKLPSSNPKFSIVSSKISKAKGGRIELKSSDDSHRLGIDFSVLSIQVLSENGGSCPGDFIPPSMLVSRKSGEIIGVTVDVINLKNRERLTLYGSITLY